MVAVGAIASHLAHYQPLAAPVIPDPRHRAAHATLSRLVTCLANEKMVKADLLHYQSSGSGQPLRTVIVITTLPNLASDSSSEETSATELVFFFQALNTPMLGPGPVDCVDATSDLSVTMTPITFLDPDEFTFPLFAIDPKSEAISTILNPDVLLNQVARANNYDKDIISAIIREMESSMAHQEHMYVHPPSPPTLESSELAWENSILEGHATHPMHKARFALPPLAPIQVGESLRHVKVVFVAVPRSQLQIRGNFEDELAPLVQAIGLQGASSDEVIVPVHSRQLPNIVSRFPFVRLLDGYDMAEAQASLRTVVPDHSPNIQLKLPLGIKVTSALRTITPWTTYLGPGLRPILERIMKDPEACIVVHETSSIVVRDPDVDEAKHLSCLIRESPTQLARARGESVVVCAALTERDANGEFHVNRAWKLNSLDRRLAFLERYVELYLRAIMPPIIEHGFAFEAHQQNTLMRYDPTTGDIKGFMVRDFGGIKAHQDTLFQTTGMRMEAIPDGCAEAESLKEVYNLAYHSIVQMNLHRLIRALGLHYNGMGWAIVRRHMRKIIPRQSELYRLWLESPTVDYKCFVTMKIDGLYRDYLYTSVPNLLLYVDHNQGVSVTAP